MAGTNDPSLERIHVFRSDLSVALARHCVGINLENLGFPGRCATSGAFDVNALETCALNTLDGVVKDMLEAESPPLASLTDPALSCASGVARVGGLMVAQEVGARAQCLLADDQAPNPESTCRVPLPPYGAGTGVGGLDDRIYDGYTALLAGVPAHCKYVRLERIGFQEGCDDTTGGRFSTFDLKLCLFDGHRKDSMRALEAAFPSPPVCGNGEVEGDEECDDGNTVNTDGCLNDCRAARCGDGVVQAGIEQCDDGNRVDTDACLNSCKTARCGDAVVQAGVEQCDDGNTNDGDPCLSTCKTARCGDGKLCSSLSPRCTSGPDAGPGNLRRR